MTIDELKNVAFHFNSHLNMEDEHRTTYIDDSGRLAFCDCVPVKSRRKKPYRVYCIDGKWYENKEDFIKALKRFGFGPQLPKKGGNND